MLRWGGKELDCGANLTYGRNRLGSAGAEANDPQIPGLFHFGDGDGLREEAGFNSLSR